MLHVMLIRDYFHIIRYSTIKINIVTERTKWVMNLIQKGLAERDTFKRHRLASRGSGKNNRLLRIGYPNITILFEHICA
jgi:hypothetical protein